VTAWLQTSQNADLIAIETAAAEVYGVYVCEMRGRTRSRPVACARAAAFYVARRLTDLSYSDLAAFFGRSSHSTVHSAIERLEGRLATGATVHIRPGDAPRPERELVDLVESIARPRINARRSA